MSAPSGDVEHAAADVAEAPPSWAVALQNAELCRPRRALPGGERVPYSVLRASAHELAELGVGVGLYFRLLRTLSLTLLLASPLYAVLVAITLSASNDAELSPLHAWSHLARLSLAPLTSTSNDASGGTVPLPGGRIDKRSALLLMSVLDLLASLVITGGLVYARADARRFARSAENACAEIRDFSVLLRLLPNDHGLSAEEVGAYVEGAVPGAKGRVVSVVVARDVGEQLVALRTLEALGEGGGDATGGGWCAWLAKRRERKAAARRKLEAQVSAFDATAARVLGAYVTLDTVAARVAVQAALPRSAGARAAAVLRCGATPRFRRAHTLTAVQAPDPANVLWENSGVSPGRRLLLRTRSAACLFLLLLLTSALAISSKSAERSQTTEVNCRASARAGTLNCALLWPTQPDAGLAAALASAGDASSCRALVDPQSEVFLVNQSSFYADANATAQPHPDAAAAAAAGCAAQACYACFCSARGLPAWAARRDAAVRPWCDAHWDAWLRSAGFRAAAIVAALVGNIGAAVCHPLLTRQERHATASKADAVEARSIFLIGFVNSFVVTLLVYADVRPLRPLRVVFNGTHADFTPVWYAQVGATLFMSCLAQALLPPVMCLLLTGVQRLRCALLRRSATAPQARLDAAAAGPIWRVSVRLGQAMQMLFFCFAVCGGMPGAFFILLCFVPMLQLLDRAFLLRVCRTPPRYDGSLVSNALEVLPYAVWLHLALTAWMYGSPSLPSFEVAAFCDDGAPRSRFVSARLCAANCWVHAVPCGLLTLALAVRAHAGAAAAAGRAACCVADAGGADDEHADDRFTLAREEGRLAGLTTYSVQDNPAYAPLLRPKLPPKPPPGSRRGANLQAASVPSDWRDKARPADKVAACAQTAAERKMLFSK